jgi:hypothetical protein
MNVNVWPIYATAMRTSVTAWPTCARPTQMSGTDLPISASGQLTGETPTRKAETDAPIGVTLPPMIAIRSRTATPVCS